MELMKIIERAMAEGRKHLAENEVKELIASAGIPTTEFQYFTELSEIDLARLSYPAVLKVCSPNILHKTDVGGVALDIPTEEDFKAKFKSFKKKFPKEGFLAEPMYTGRVEIIIGLTNDAAFGLTIMFGLGGIYTEVYKDVTFRVIPIGREDAEEMLTEIEAAPILEGYRKVKVDREGILELLLKVSRLGMELQDHLDQMDLNPVFVTGNDVRVVDAKMILR